MVDGLIPEDMKAFLLSYIDSIAQLEALLLLRTHPDDAWSAETLARRLYISTQETTVLLESLSTNGFLVTTDQTTRLYRYHCLSPDLASLVDRVADLYTKYLISVTNLIHGKSYTRVQAFADAFKLRKDA